MVVLPASPLVTKEKRNTFTKKTNETHTHTLEQNLSLSLLALFLAPPLLSLFKGPPPPSFVCVLLCGHTNKKEKKKEKL